MGCSTKYFKTRRCVTRFQAISYNEQAYHNYISKGTFEKVEYTPIFFFMILNQEIEPCYFFIINIMKHLFIFQINLKGKRCVLTFVYHLFYSSLLFYEIYVQSDGYVLLLFQIEKQNDQSTNLSMIEFLELKNVKCVCIDRIVSFHDRFIKWLQPMQSIVILNYRLKFV